MSNGKKKRDRRKFSQADKDATVAKLREAMQAGSTLRAFADAQGIAESVLRRWVHLGTHPKAQRVQRAASAKAAPDAPAPATRGADHYTSYTREQKLAAVAELDAGGNASAIATRLGITTSGLYYWRKTRDKLAGTNARRTGKAVVVAEALNGNGTHRIPQVAAVHAMRDATIFLRKAKHELLDGIRAGNIDDLDSSHLLSLLALKALTGGA